MVDTRESRAHAAEIKYLVDSQMGDRIRAWARAHLEADAHGSGSFGDEYLTASLYFDNPDFDVFNRRGSFGRAKYRIRRYEHGDTVFLERKLRRPGMVVKRRTLVPIEVLESLEDPVAARGQPGHWFRRRVRARGLRPICQVSYHRVARGLIVNGWPARLTLDSGLRAVPVQEARFGLAPGVPVLEPQQVLELKCRMPLPDIFERMIEDLGLRQQVVSKYRSSMTALGHAPAVVEPLVLEEEPTGA
jgi:hypothetical protein